MWYLLPYDFSLSLDHLKQEIIKNDASADVMNILKRSVLHLQVSTHVAVYWADALNTLIWYLGER